MLRALTHLTAWAVLAACTASGSPEMRTDEEQSEDGHADPGLHDDPPVQPPPGTGVVTGTRAPSLDLPRLDATGRWRLADLVESPEGSCPSGALLAFMASWCGPCAASLPSLAALEQTHPDLEIVTVVVDDSPRGRQAELTKVRAAGLTGPVVAADPETTTRWTGGSRSVPRFVFIDRSGTIVAQDRGFGDEVRALLPDQARRTIAP